MSNHKDRLSRDRDIRNVIYTEMGADPTHTPGGPKSVYSQKMFDDVLEAVKTHINVQLSDSSYAKAVRRSNKRRAIARKILRWLEGKARALATWCEEYAATRFAEVPIVSPEDINGALRSTLIGTAVETYPEDLPRVSGLDWDNTVEGMCDAKRGGQEDES